MNKEFIPYEQALELKELGFNEPCFGYWKMSDWLIEEKTRTDGYTHADQLCSAPLFQQAFRWFREKYDLDYSLLPESSSGHRLLDRTFNIVIYKYYMNMNVQAEIVRIDGKIARYNKREEAELACLKKLIEIVKEKK
jgi:hypothetical protein